MFKLYKKYLKKNLIWVILGPCFKILEAIFELLVPLIIKNIIDKGIKGDFASIADKKDYIWSQGILLIVFAFTGLCSTLVCQFIASRVSQRFGTDLRNDYFKHINELSFKELDYLNTSSIITRQTSDIFNVEKSVAMLIRLVIRSPFIVIGSTALAFYIDTFMGFIFLATSILLLLIFFIIMKITVPANIKVQKNLDNVSVVVKENLSGVRQVRAFRKEEYEINRFNNNSNNLLDSQIHMSRFNALLNPLTFIIVNTTIILVMIFGRTKINDHALTVGSIQALINYLNQILVAIIAITNLVTIFTKAIASSARINEVLDLKSSITDGPLSSANDYENIVSFKNVTFNYNIEAKPAISNISFDVKKGQIIGIIGGTGAGKSTISNLINRFYDVTEGNIYLFGNNIKDYNLKFLRSNISTVMQNTVLFNGTIKSNLLVGNKNATKEQLNKAIEISQSSFVYNFDDKLEHRVLQGGKNLSGGQRQRLSICRALVKDSEILILDDSSSALDYETDYKLRMALKKLNKTIFIISQRASSLINADKIIVLDNGNLEAIGTHDELLLKSNVYKEICISQELIKGGIN